MGLEFSRVQLEAVFAEIDADADRALNFDEFRELIGTWKRMGVR